MPDTCKLQGRKQCKHMNKLVNQETQDAESERKAVREECDRRGSIREDGMMCKNTRVDRDQNEYGGTTKKGNKIRKRTPGRYASVRITQKRGSGVDEATEVHEIVVGEGHGDARIDRRWS